MTTAAKRVLVLVSVLTLTLPLNAQNKLNNTKETKPAAKIKTSSEPHQAETPTPAIPQKGPAAFVKFLNKKAYAAKIDKKEEKRILREKWEKLLGVDIFYPYFKAKEVEDWISDKASVKVFNIRGRPKFENNQVKYTFKIKF